MGNLVCYVAGTDMNIAPAGHIEAVLLNVPSCWKSKSAPAEAIQLFKELGAEYRMLDSGGYQIYCIENKKPEIVYIKGKPEAVLKRPVITCDPTKPVYSKNTFNLTPQHTIQTAVTIGANYMQSEDYPVKHSKIKGEQGYQFRRAAYFNACNAQETGFLREKYCPGIKFLVPVQAYNINQFDEFMSLVGTEITIDGLSLPIRNHDPGSVCLMLVKFSQMGFRIVHILGTSKFWVIAVLAYFARNHFDIVSFDACSWRDAAKQSVYFEPFTLFPIVIKDENKQLSKLKINCSCPWCSYEKSFVDMLEKPYDNKFMFLCRHNWFVVEQASREFHSHAASPLTLKNFLMEKAYRRKKDIDLIYRCLCSVDININRSIGVLEAMLSGIEIR